MSKLYDLAEAYHSTLALIDDEETDQAMVMEALEGIMAPIEAKVGNVAKIIQGLDYDVKAIRAEEDRLAKKRKAIENRQQGIKDWLQSQMEYAGLEEIKTPTHKVSIQANPWKVEIDDEGNVPAEYCRVIPEKKEPDKAKIKQALSKAVEIPGARLIRTRSVRIR